MATEAKAKNRLKCTNDIAFDSRNPLYIAAKSILPGLITLLLSDGSKACSDSVEWEFLLFLCVVHCYSDPRCVDWECYALGEKG